ncbi:MAG: PPOX class F420-dependent oxidoreductase [Anaerolineae bacterium]|nr:PPOX class F420-dependent oxidoreductase [Anaerolineae bacterium]
MPAFDHIPESHRDLLDRPIVVALVTLMPDGWPQATPIWCLYDGEHVIVNTARGRQKDRNMKQRPHVTILSIDPDNPYRWLEVRGEVVAITEEGAVDVINTLAKMYRGTDSYYGGVTPLHLRDQETRVTFKVKPIRVLTGGQAKDYKRVESAETR